ncbi:uridine phosphorylase, putative [Perkinsus marinus ATCC 50983]|uniref:Uridine phosphorylase, putative n=1 Tax=Perkinsus marinus (strain ATCC 50983 / TXsc) TaxID=423536 RepID=C5LCZ3_PERM5|nr:uridine phosphorylase, putative [Perkinsus marinus ATCC 50983]EER05337.1 uridine phosphorylase, putative [Perkinsus marinus ATCC 50983]|eukprot:XP_002773521.1 uridine phosphorylase, putative [Perkinsus marinus ATCC 50983]
MTYEAPHLKICEGDINPIVLVVGDPFRAEVLATKFCDTFKELSFNREYRSYNVEFEGVKLSICSHGIGGPGAMICFEELIKCGAKVILRLGTCGSLKPDTIKTGDLVVSTGACREDGVTQYLVPTYFPAIADSEICLALRDAAKNMGVHNCHTGITLSSALFYAGPCEETSWVKNATAGALAIEMENSPLFTIASLRSIRAAAIGTVDGSPLRWDQGDYDPHGEVCRKGKESMYVIGLSVAKRVAQGEI